MVQNSPPYESPFETQNKWRLVGLQVSHYLQLISTEMKKLGINYSRVFPDHRVPIDYHFNKELMQGPSTYFRLLKDGFNTGLTKNFHVYLPLAALVVFGVTSFAVFWNHDTGTIELAKKNIPGYKYVLLTQRGGYGAYDNILQRFEKEPGGIRDQPYDQ